LGKCEFLKKKQQEVEESLSDDEDFDDYRFNEYNNQNVGRTNNNAKGSS